MILNKIKLENIRSYLNEEINFPLGSVLLSGDIGSGKSSILLAIDFVLFGLRKNELSGASLLRNGKDNGNVELHFTIDNKHVIVKRSLKRDGSVAQSSGYIKIDGVKKEGTALEIKEQVLNLLNYPKTLLTKSKSLIYRYTIYTPQEEMKQILLSDIDSRLDTLRKVFGIDKYKRVKENTKLFITKLKEKKRELSGVIIDLEDKKKEFDENKRRVDDTQNKISYLIPELSEIKNNLLKENKNIEEIENKISRLNEIKKGLEISEIRLNNYLNQNKRNKEELESIEGYIKELKIDEFNNKSIEEGEVKVSFVENELKIINSKITEFRAIKNNSEKIRDEISKLEICPICKQNVSENHKHSVIEKENKLLNEIKEELNANTEKEKKLSQELIKLRKELENLKIKKREFEINTKTLKEKENSKSNLIKLQEEIKKEIGKINVRKNEMLKENEELKNVEGQYKTIKIRLEDLRNREKAIEIRKATLETELNNFNKIIGKLDKEISNKSKIKENLAYLSKLQDWLETSFINSMEAIEKQIMLKAHSDFDELFQKWFNMLVDDENLRIRLDNEFSPLIEQNNHDINYLYLSGGEKTAAALAYRLALNQVINNLMVSIKTTELIILDEPTDGFSDEQLDKIRDVLNELNTKQIILVSHEPKIETFVDYIIRLKKENHVTRILNGNN